MHKEIFSIALLILSLFLIMGATCSASINFTDTAGNQISLSHPAERIVCLNSNVAESLVVLGAGNRVVGVTDSTLDDPVLVFHLPKARSVGNWQTPSIERILQLKPDAVITYASSRPKNAEQMQQAGIELIYLDCYKIDTLEHDIRALGSIIGKPDAGDQYLNFFNHWKGLIEERVSNISAEKIPDVYIEGYSDFSAQGNSSGSDLIVTIARGRNLAADLGEQWPKVTPEWIMREDPDIILKIVSVKPDISLDEIRMQIKTRKGFEILSAVKTDNVYALNGNLLFGTRSPAGMIYIAKLIHPDLFKDVSATDVITEYANKFVKKADEGDYFSPKL